MRNSLILAFFFTFLISFSISHYAEAQGMHGVFRVVKGNVQVKSGKNGALARAKVGQKVFPQDTIIAGADSRAKIVMVDNNEINVSPDSQIVFEKYEGQPGAAKKEVLLNVIYGKVRSKVEQKYDGKTSKFQIKTPSAVAGVRGTDFLTSFDQGTKQTSIVTFEGKVELGSMGANGQIVNSVGVGVGQTASMTAGSAPTAPTQMPASELKAANTESNAETASDGGGDSRTPATSKSEDKGDKEKKNGDAGEKKSDEGKKSEGGEKKPDGGDKKTEGGGDKKPAAGGDKPAGGDKAAANGSGEKSASGNGSGGSTVKPAVSAGAAPSSGTNASPPAAGAREPASIGGGTKFMPPPPPPVMTVAPPPLPQAPQLDFINIPKIPEIPVCDFCNQVIENGNSQVTIKVNR